VFGSGEKPQSQGPAHTLISCATEIIGDVHFTGELIVEGKVRGNIYAEDNSDALIRVVDTGSVEGEICVPSVVINGLVQGDVRSAKHVVLAAKAVVVGDIYYNLIEMVMGSEVNGNLMHTGAGQSATKRLTADPESVESDKDTLEND